TDPLFCVGVIYGIRAARLALDGRMTEERIGVVEQYSVWTKADVIVEPDERRGTDRRGLFFAKELSHVVPARCHRPYGHLAQLDLRVPPTNSTQLGGVAVRVDQRGERRGANSYVFSRELTAQEFTPVLVLGQRPRRLLAGLAVHAQDRF